MITKDRPRAVFTEIGTSGIQRFGGTVREEFLQALSGQQGVRVYREMRDNDAIIGGVMFAIEQVIKKVSWFVDPAGFDNEDMRAAEFLGSCMTDLSHTWQDMITEAATCLTYGWAWLEVVMKLRKGHTNDPRTRSKHNDGRVGWRKMALRLQSSLHEWEFDDNGGIRAMVQSAPPDYKYRVLPIERSLLFRTVLNGNNPEGRSLLRNLYRGWYIKKNIEEIEAIGIERDLVGLPVVHPPEGYDITAPENSAVKSGVEKMIANLRRDEQEGVCLPFGWELELLSMGRSVRQFDTDRIISRWDKRLCAAVLAQFIMLGMDRVGSFALSADQHDLFLVASQGHLDAFDAILNNYAVPRLFEMNPEFSHLVGANRLPRFVPGKVTEPKLKDVGAYVKDLAGVGFLVPDEDIMAELRRIGGFDERWQRRLGAVISDKKKPKQPKQPDLKQPDLKPTTKPNGHDREGDPNVSNA